MAGYDFLPNAAPPGGFDLLSYLNEISAPQPGSAMSIPNSPMSANGTQPNMAGTTGGIVPTNPMGYTTWSQAGGLGNYFGANSQLFGSIADLLGKGIGAYTSLKGLSLAEDALSLEKKRFRTNLANQVSSYNTQMRDRIAGRSYATEEERQAALNASLLPTPEKKKKGM